MLNEKKLDIILALAVFFTAFTVYFSTMAPTVSFWDTGEWIAASHILGNPHPPGNPVFTLLGRAFIVMMPFAEKAARVNFISVLSMALASMVAYLFVLKSLRLIFSKGGLNRFAMYTGAIIGGLLVAFSDTVWFSAVETAAYSPAMLIVMLNGLLALHWYARRGTPAADRILLLIAYIGMLGVGVHIFAFITIPVIGLFFLLDRDTRANIPLILAGLVLLSVIYDVGNFVFYASGSLIVCAAAFLMTRTTEWRRRWSLAGWLSLAALLGFSTYLYVPIRSHTDVLIDEGTPRTWPVFQEYVERKQYGSESMIRRAFHRRAQIEHQVLIHPHMGYGGYMLSQYFPWKVGDRSEETTITTRSLFGIELTFPELYRSLQERTGVQLILFLLLQIPFLYGGLLAYRRNRKIGLFLLGLYVATSYGLVFYLNFSDGTQLELRDYRYWEETGFDPEQKPSPVHMEVRERDYFFTPGFMYMGILFGISAAFFLNWLATRRRFLLRPAGFALIAISFAVPVWSNYHEHNRSRDYVPYDYAYNLLNSCRPNSILFTNGDNDTFPLWFMQQVEGIRTDVRVVNLSLVNTSWYMHQLYEHEPKLEIGFTPEEIDNLRPQAWRFNGPVEITIPGTEIRYQLDPLPYLRVQDIMILHIVQNNFPERPVHFAVTIGGNNSMGLDQFTFMEGMVYTLTEERRNRDIDVAATARLVDSVYRFRGLGDERVHIDKTTEGLLTNYSATNFRLAGWAQDSLESIMPELTDLREQEDLSPAGRERLEALEENREEMLAFAEQYLELNANILPGEWRVHYYFGQLYLVANEPEKAEAAFREGMATRGPSAKVFALNLVELFSQEGRAADAKAVLAEMAERFPEDLEVAYRLAEMHQQDGEPLVAREILSDWLRKNPGHEYAGAVEQQIRRLDALPQSPPTEESDADATPALPLE